MTWRARLSVGAPFGLACIALLVALDTWLVNRLITHDIRLQQLTFLSFVMGLAVLLSVPALLSLIYHTMSCLSLRYRLDRNGLTVRWHGGRQVIPLRDVQRIVLGRDLGEVVVRRRGMRWPGYEHGEGAVPGIGRTRFLATVPLREQLVLVTPGVAVAISPRDADGFREALAARQEMGPNRLLEPEYRHAGWLDWPLWTDKNARALLGAAVTVNLGLFAYLCARFPGLDVGLPLHFTSQGLADRIGGKAELFALPIIGALILATNLLLGLVLYPKERTGSYLLWGSASAVQALVWLATLSILR